MAAPPAGKDRPCRHALPLAQLPAALTPPIWCLGALCLNLKHTTHDSSTSHDPTTLQPYLPLTHPPPPTPSTHTHTPAWQAVPLFTTSMLVPLLVVVLQVMTDTKADPPRRLTPQEAAPAVFHSMFSQVGSPGGGGEGVEPSAGGQQAGWACPPGCNLLLAIPLFPAVACLLPPPSSPKPTHPSQHPNPPAPPAHCNLYPLAPQIVMLLLPYTPPRQTP